MDKKILRTLAVLTVGIGLNAVPTNQAAAEMTVTHQPVWHLDVGADGADRDEVVDVRGHRVAAPGRIVKSWRNGEVGGDGVPCTTAQASGICAGECPNSNGTIDENCYEGCLGNTVGQNICYSDSP